MAQAPQGEFLPPKEFAAAALRAGMIEPELYAEDLICISGGTSTWYVNPKRAVWLRSLELPADMEVEQATIAGYPGTLTPGTSECGTRLVDDGPPDHDALRALGGLPGELSARARAYRVEALPGSLSLYIDFGDRLGMRVASPGQVIALTFRPRAGVPPQDMRRFQVRLHGDVVV